jgi:hypothetical protein
MQAQIDKQELKNWIDTLDNKITLLLLQSLKEAPSVEEWFWEDISTEQKGHIIDALKKAERSDEYSQKELWEEVKYQYAHKDINEPPPEALKESLRQAEEDIKAGRVYTSEEVWAEIDRRRKQRS